ncbi:biotin/lipoyl-containing protein [Kocuria atrinae]|uniref:biotin/lipoyl-containing protein n=1 Tax=Kocuria atrinae TaxID=592377 RepID=UPI0002FAEB69|nr:biotin/lipoyl-containing protein [Kocuria atrinae]
MGGLTREHQCVPSADLGEGLTEADILHWLVAEGDTVAMDQPIVEVETAKSAVEIPSPFEGTVHQLHGAEGETLTVGQSLISVSDGARPRPRRTHRHRRSMLPTQILPHPPRARATARRSARAPSLRPRSPRTTAPTSPPATC